MASLRATKEQIRTLFIDVSGNLIDPDIEPDMIEGSGWEIESIYDDEHGHLLRVRDLERDYYIDEWGDQPYG